jgi:hypothetical protein
MLILPGKMWYHGDSMRIYWRYNDVYIYIPSCKLTVDGRNPAPVGNYWASMMHCKQWDS